MNNVSNLIYCTAEVLTSFLERSLTNIDSLISVRRNFAAVPVKYEHFVYVNSASSHFNEHDDYELQKVGKTMETSKKLRNRLFCIGYTERTYVGNSECSFIGVHFVVLVSI
jgi:hypothetical protein